MKDIETAKNRKKKHEEEGLNLHDFIKITINLFILSDCLRIIY